MTHKDIQFYFFLGLLGVALIFTGILFSPFLKLFIVVAIIAVIFHPLYEKIRKSFIYNANGAAFLTIFVAIVIVLIPIIFFTIKVLAETRNIYGNIHSFSATLSVLSDTLTLKFQTIIPTASIDLSAYITNFFGNIVGSIGNIFSSVVHAITICFLGIISLFFFLRDGRAFIQRLITVTPLADTYGTEILAKQKQAITSIVKGSIFVACIQGICAWLGFVIFGIPNPALWGGVTVLASFIPGIGTALVIIPAAIYLSYTGTMAGAIGLTVWGFILVGLVDNFIRPFLMSREVKIHPFLILMSIFGGLIMFGPVGLLFGPLILSLVSSLLDMYPLITKHTLT